MCRRICVLLFALVFGMGLVGPGTTATASEGQTGVARSPHSADHSADRVGKRDRGAVSRPLAAQSAPQTWSGNVGPRGVTCPPASLEVHRGDDPQAALDAAGAGATVCFRRGTYRLEQALRPLSGQTLVFRPHAVLNGSEIVTNWTTQGGHWSSTGHHHYLPNSTGLPDDVVCQSGPRPCIFEDVFLDARPLHHVTSLSDLDQPNEVFFDRSAGTIYVDTDPTNRLVEMTVAGSAIASPADDVTIRGATIEHFAYTGIDISADRWTVDRSHIRRVHFQAIGIYGETGTVIQNTRVRRCGIIGMTAVDVSSLTIQGNEFDHNNYLHAGPRDSGYHEGAIKILQSHDVAVRGNWSHHNFGDGLWFDFDNYNILIEDNILENNTRNGLQYEASFDATVRYNTIRNNGTDWASQGAGIYNSTSKDVEYYGNWLEDNVIRSIVITWHDRGWSARFGERQSANLFFHDNVVVLDDNFQSWVGVYWNQDPRVYTSGNMFQGNTYFTHHPTERLGEQYWLWGGKDLTWAQWQAKGFDVAGSYSRR